MRLVVDFDEVRQRQVGIALCGRQPGVPEQLLHTSEVGPRFKQMGRERMAQTMRRDALGKSCPAAQRVDDARSLTSVESVTTSPHEERPFPFGRQMMPEMQPFTQRVHAGVAQRRHTLFRTLAQHPHNSGGRVGVKDIQPQRLRDTQPGPVQQLGQREVSTPDGLRMEGVAGHGLHGSGKGLARRAPGRKGGDCGCARIGPGTRYGTSRGIMMPGHKTPAAMPADRVIDGIAHTLTGGHARVTIAVRGTCRGAMPRIKQGEHLIDIQRTWLPLLLPGIMDSGHRVGSHTAQTQHITKEGTQC